jgi:perosamine synthetase
MNSYNDRYVGTVFDYKEINAIKKILIAGKSLTRGKNIEIFEKDFGKHLGAKFAVAVSSCSAALEITSKILDLKKGDEVICQANSFWTCINHLLKIGVKIVCADLEKNSLNIDSDHVKKLINNKTKAIYILHHGGIPADLDKIKSCIKKKKIFLVEDCAHSLGSKYKNKKIGSDSDLACFSFSSLKNISTLGEGGMIITNNFNFYEKAKLLRDGQVIGKKIKIPSLVSKQFISLDNNFMPIGNNLKEKFLKINNIGSTFRMSDVQAAVGSIQLKKLKLLNKKRAAIYNIYEKVLIKNKNILLIKPKYQKYKNSYHLFNFFIVTKDKYLRNQIIDNINKKFDINAKIRFSPINWYPAMRKFGCKIGGCAKCLKLYNCENSWLFNHLSLPISPRITIKDANFLAKNVSNIISHYFNK